MAFASGRQLGADKLEELTARHDIRDGRPDGGWPGAGGQRGPRKATMDARALCDQLVNNPTYQAKLRRDFCARRVHPTIEALVWAYHAGRPTERVDVTAMLGVTAIVEQRKALAALPLDQLEAMLATIETAMARVTQVTEPQDVVATADLPKVSEELLEKSAGSDNVGYGYQSGPSSQDALNPGTPTACSSPGTGQSNGDGNT